MTPFAPTLPRPGPSRAGLLLLALLALATPARAETLRLGGTGAAIGSMALMARAFQRIDPTFQLQIVPNLGSSGGIKALTAGAVQLAAISRPIKAAEAAAGLQVTVYGRTPFVIATVKPGIEALTRAQVAELFSGRQARWADGQPVRLVLRPASDGDTALLGGLSPAVQAAVDIAMAREGMVTAMTDQDSADAIERLPGGLGTSSLALLMSERRRARALAIDGVAPTVPNLLAGRYPYAKTMALVSQAGAPPVVTKFLAFVGSEAGRRVLADTGHALPVGVAAPAGR